MDLEKLILQHVHASNYKPVKPKVIAKQLDVPEELHRDLKKAIKHLVKSGRISYGPNHLVRPAQLVIPPKRPSSAVIGVFRRTSAGFGFVRPQGTPAAAGRTNDIYIPSRYAKDASSGDVVQVRIKKKRDARDEAAGRDNRIRGEIVDVIERETHQFVGTYFERDGDGYVKVDGNVFSQPVLVGDPGAKNAKPNDKVVIEMVRFPSHASDGEGVITEVLGARGAPGVDTLSIIREFNLPEAFPEDVLEAARRQADRFRDEVTDDRDDWTAATVITIDPVDARDFDDAISLVQLDNGHWQLGVHIADVTHFVPLNSPQDQEARQRATSVYLPDRVIPMLPEVISNNLASLQPQRVRFTKTAVLEFTPEGIRTHTELRRTAIRSKRRFTYEEVDDYLARPERWQSKLEPDVFQLLGHMRELAMILRKRRLKHGAIELTMPELKIDLDKQGRVSGAHIVENTVSHQIIEEFMLAANQAVAEWLHRKELFFLRRIHAIPDLRKLQALTQFVRELGIACDSLESRFEIKRVLADVTGKPEERAVNFAVLRSMQKAVYGPEVDGHYALNMDHYCHFTSPIRRYPDLTVHRMLDQIFEGKHPVNDMTQLLVLGEHCSEREQRAERAERELIKVKLLNYLSDRIGMKMDAVVTGVEDFGLFAQGVQLPAEGLIHVNSLQDDYYHYDDKTHSLVGRRQGNSYRLGDVIEVEISHVDVDRRELDFRMVRLLKKSPSPPARSKPEKSYRKSKEGRAGGQGSKARGRRQDEGPGRGKRPRKKGR